MLSNVDHRKVAGQKAEYQNGKGQQQQRKLRPHAHACQAHYALPALADTHQHGKRGQHVDPEA